MFPHSRIALLLMWVLLGSSVLLAQDRDNDNGDRRDRAADDHSDHQDYDRQSDRHHPRTSPLDYLFLPGFPGSRFALSVAPDGLVNSVIAMPFHLDRYFRVGHANLSISVPYAGSHAYVGIYDAHGNLLVQGKFPTDEAKDLTVEISPRVMLKPGMYYFAIGGEDATTMAIGYLFDEGNLNFIHSGLATNQIMDGSLPATLGTVSPQIASTPSAVFTF